MDQKAGWGGAGRWTEGHCEGEGLVAETGCLSRLSLSQWLRLQGPDLATRQDPSGHRACLLQGSQGGKGLAAGASWEGQREAVEPG